MYNFAFLDETTKREIRRKILKAIAIPGYQVPFASREMPLAKGWGTGGLQITLSIIGPEDVIKVIDQGDDHSLNAINIRRFIKATTGVRDTTRTEEATIIQTRHRIPEINLREDQVLVFQVPYPEPLRWVEPSEEKTRKMHAQRDYSSMWLYLYEGLIKYGEIPIGARYPVLVNRRYLMDPSPIPKWDIKKLNRVRHLSLFGAGREKRIYAVPPYTEVRPLEFEDVPFKVENFKGRVCARCGSADTFLDEVPLSEQERLYVCSDTDFCSRRAKANGASN
ncbi:MAG: alpha-D-ribose 1-methylphosphonate 5-phosphate C-P-lyase PhnJ [Aquificaceae bacterium]|nr:alpha-D-ribose 1-methylphosphonate 5-phosphate C-P-lyase PhnJ [Aquificaceae bacterium]MDW8097695.1 alpha-D-ribose 1-methylphosphonate 5-phosphate C-P-lyase PhnJ [Aquificaceae bacterium]